MIRVEEYDVLIGWLRDGETLTEEQINSGIAMNLEMINEAIAAYLDGDETFIESESLVILKDLKEERNLLFDAKEEC